MRLTWAILGTAMMLAGCGGGPQDMSDPQGTVAPAGPVAPATCGADRFQSLVGQPEANLQATSLPSPVLIYQIGAPIPQDFNPGRLKIEFDKSRIITRAYCG